MKVNKELWPYLKVLIFGFIIYGFSYGYNSYLKTPNLLNKGMADTSIILIGLSMWLSSLAYFFNLFDSKIMYRKQLGLIGFAFALVHVALSFSALRVAPAPVTGLFATGIFSIMALISSRSAMVRIGVQKWRRILRAGYIAMLFVAAHVVLLKSARWMTWYNGGMKTLPSLSLLETIFIAVVIVMRLLMWLRIRLANKNRF
ncbi:MAG: hypothetical protein ABI758_01955 [Candidatus Woesebacteria bacterium]